MHVICVIPLVWFHIQNAGTVKVYAKIVQEWDTQYLIQYGDVPPFIVNKEHCRKLED